VEAKIIEDLSEDDWKYIVSLEQIGKVLWNNFCRWVDTASVPKEDLPKLLKEAKQLEWKQFDEKEKIDIFMIGKQNENENLMLGIGEVLKESSVKTEILQVLSKDDWKRTLGPQLNKTLWQNLADWIQLFPQHKDQLPDMLAAIKDIDWRGFSNAEIEELFLLGKQIGAEQFTNTRGMLEVLEDEVKISTLKALTASDWKSILHECCVSSGHWKKLMSWSKLGPDNENEIADVLETAEYGSFAFYGSVWPLFNEENIIEAYLVGKKHGIESLVFKCALGMKNLNEIHNLEQL
jgi:hypothetical protein